MNHVYDQRSRFGPTLESESLPVVGHGRGLRAPIWQRLAVAGLGFAIVLGAILLIVRGL